MMALTIHGMIDLVVFFRDDIVRGIKLMPDWSRSCRRSAQCVGSDSGMSVWMAVYVREFDALNERDLAMLYLDLVWNLDCV